MKLNKDQSKKIDGAITKLASARAKFATHIEEYNDALHAAFEVLSGHQENLATDVEEVNEEVRELATELREAFDAKSEKWQESDAAGLVGAWIELWENFEAVAESFDEPDGLEMDDGSDSDGSMPLEEIPTESEDQ